MPPAVIAAAIFVGASVTTLAVAAAVIGALEMIVVNLAIGALMKGLAGKPNVAPPPLNVTMKGTIEPRHLIFGTRRAGGVMVNHATSGPSNDHLWFVIVLSGHQVTKITDVWLDQIMVPDANINPSTGLVSGAKIYSLSGTLVSGSNIVSNVEVPSNMVTGGAVTGVAIPAATTITAIGLNTITLSKSATATVAALERGTAGAYNIVDDRPTTWRELIEGIALSRNAPRPIPLPGWVLRAAAPYAGKMMTGVNMHVSNAKAKRDLGWTPRYPTFREGLADS